MYCPAYSEPPYVVLSHGQEKQLACGTKKRVAPTDEEELKDVFSQRIDYRRFHDLVLHQAWKGESIYNNYGIETYCQLQNHQINALDRFQNQEEKECRAGIAVYDAIVHLYLERVLNQYPVLNHQDYLPALSAIALGVAIKLSYDDAIWNVDINHFIYPYLDVVKYNSMERAFLKAINWDTSINLLKATVQTPIRTAKSTAP